MYVCVCVYKIQVGANLKNGGGSWCNVKSMVCNHAIMFTFGQISLGKV